MLNRFQFIREFFISIELKVVTGSFVRKFLLLKLAIVETRYGQFSGAAAPFGDGLIAVAIFRADQRAGADESIALGKMEGHIKDGPVSKLSAAVVWIPGRARNQYEIT